MKTIGILGGSKFSSDSQYYNIAQNLGKFLHTHNYNIICGGGRGIMSALASSYIDNPERCGRVCLESDVQSDNENYQFDNVGTKITVSTLDMQSHTIFNNSDICLFFPGGSGTIHEFSKFLAIDLHNIKKMVLLGTYFESLYDIITNHNKYSSLINEKITSNYDMYINNTIFFVNDNLLTNKYTFEEYITYILNT